MNSSSIINSKAAVRRVFFMRDRSFHIRQGDRFQYIAAGGTIVEYGKRLTERQNAEIAIYERVKTDIEKARKSMTDDAFMPYWEKRNDELRNLGIKTVGLEQD